MKWHMGLVARSASMNANAATKFSIQVLYNGLTETLNVVSREQIVAVLNRAANLFHINQNRHLLSLFLPDGSEIRDQQSVEDAGLKPGELIALRPSTVKGGTA
jgi:hypothetical protein